MNNDSQRFRNFAEALYAVDVTFQQSFRPSGAIEEGKLYLSGKHKLYGLKVEVAVLPNGIGLACSAHHPGSASDFEIMHCRREIHLSLLKKKEDESSMRDDGLHAGQYPEHWGVIADKGYQGALGIMRAILPI